ncbi:Synaptic vesicle transporter SVOP and related transporters (major facilitator superfamily) [Phaffia rhodozyma]|uniref:Synaptic vesicle transporter SVOP and related transporters (Major facilitator superfamily) n=1 Tax=Phaffia rhodozyma TaxID=264483 RepID=A0A0F7SQE8_PHARH|nr:Synaptic vesicle transporter SVOP and related transporters (major facilitator superfamily) [Phaffia rhodozyma]
MLPPSASEGPSPNSPSTPPASTSNPTLAFNPLSSPNPYLQEPQPTPEDQQDHHAHFSNTLVSVPPSPVLSQVTISTTADHVTTPSPTLVNVDIEHVAVDNDPRLWSPLKKNIVLAMVSIGSIPVTLGAAIYNPAFDELRSQLNATDNELSLSVSLFILFQGCCPVFWSSIAEVKGRKSVYLISYVIFLIGSVVSSRANTMTLLIVMRMVQAFGSSAVLSIGAGTLADMFEPEVRGSKMGLYYGTPLLGTSMGPIVGGALTQAFGWRSTFYFISAFGAVALFAFCFFPDSWRKERSLAYQAALKKSIADSLVHAEKKRKRKLAKGLRSTDATPAPTRPGSPTNPDPEKLELALESEQINGKKKGGRRRWWLFGERTGDKVADGTVKIGLRDVNPLLPALAILKCPSNLLTVISSGIIFAAQYSISFTAAVTFAESPYNYNALKIGLVLVAFGGGNIIGSVAGGRYSDYVLARLMKKNGGVREPEMRLKSVFVAMPIMVLSFLGYGWTANEKTNVAGPVVFLVTGGISVMVIYASVLAFLVDSNPGRSSSAVASNSFCRGLFAFAFSQSSLPIRNGIGDGGLYSLFSGMLLLTCVAFVVLTYKGKQWREPDHSFGYKRRHRHDLEAQAQNQTQTKDQEINPSDLKDVQPVVP